MNEWMNKYKYTNIYTVVADWSKYFICVWSRAIIKKILGIIGIIVFEIRDYLYKKRPYDQKYFHHCS